MTSSSGDTVISIRGKEVISERECTRDAEWKLLYVSLQRSSVHQEVSARLPLCGILAELDTFTELKLAGERVALCCCCGLYAM